MNKAACVRGGSVCGLLVSMLMTAGIDAHAQSNVRRDLADCTAIEIDAQRLACFDRYAAGLPTRPAEAPDASAPTTGNGLPDQQPTAQKAEAAIAPVTAPVTGNAPGDVPPVPLADAPNESDFGFHNERATQTDKIETRFIGDFTGWSGKTLFWLENAQVWKQIESGRVRYRITNPAITIERAAFGSYRLRVEGLNRTVRVKRIK